MKRETAKTGDAGAEREGGIGDTTAKRADTRLETSHLLVGILRAEHGTVPRALAYAQIDRQQLVASAEAALTSPIS